ncbi:MAG: carcinine hydrolase/isopenicillin-N N-acyltransferase family protein [Sutterella sp.]
MTIQLSSICAALASVLLMSASANACTVFAATGPEFVQGGGTLISKVRDERSFKHVVKTVKPEQGYAYTGLFNGKKQKFNMGVNEKGFVVFRTTTGSVPKEVRKQYKRYKSEDGFDGQEFLIRNCATVDEALKHVEVFSKEPTNYMMADAKKIAVVEVLPGGRHVVTVRDRGTLAHTNHYITKDSFECNVVSSQSSQVRLNRIRKLLDTTAKPFSIQDFINFTENKNDGPDDSIFRLGTPGKDVSTTLATMAVYIPETGAPEIYLKWRDNPEDKTSWQNKRETVDFAK